MKLGILGASGLAREARDIAHSIGYREIVFIDQVKTGVLQDSPVLNEKDIGDLAKDGYKFVIGIGSPAIRKAVKDRFPTLCYINLVHPAASFGYGQIEIVNKTVGNIFFPGARLTNSIQVGNFGVYYLNVAVTHDCIIQDYVTIASGASISGNVQLSQGCYIGTNACIIQGTPNNKRVIGSNSIVGAGAVVTKDVPENTIVMGVPATSQR